METYDLKKVLRELYPPGRGGFAWVDVPQLPFLMIDRHGDPNTSDPRKAEPVKRRPILSPSAQRDPFGQFCRCLRAG